MGYGRETGFYSNGHERGNSKGLLLTPSMCWDAGLDDVVSREGAGRVADELDVVGRVKDDIQGWGLSSLVKIGVIS